MIKLKFEETMELLMGRHSTNLGGTTEWIDWDAVYADLVEEGYESSEASILLDDFIEENGL
jgi:ketol-acid reductoisomerase